MDHILEQILLPAASAIIAVIGLIILRDKLNIMKDQVGLELQRDAIHSHENTRKLLIRTISRVDSLEYELKKANNRILEYQSSELTYRERIFALTKNLDIANQTIELLRRKNEEMGRRIENLENFLIDKEK